MANRKLGIINSLSEQQALDELSQFYTRGIPTYQHMDGVLQGLKQIEKRTSEMLMETGRYVKPSGAYDPAAAESQWHGWVSAYGNQGTRDAASGLSGYDVSTYGTILGVDKSFNNMVVGLSGGTAGSTIDQDDADSEVLNYTLIDGTDPHYFTIQAPAKDTFDLGVSIGALFGENFEVSLGFDGRYSKEFTAISYNGKIQYSF